MLVVAAVLALLVGLALGMLGGGGAILTLPMLVYVLHVEAKTAIATSLFVVGSTSLVGTTFHARAGNVRWRVGAIFGAAAMAGAFAGGHLAHFVPGAALLVAFGAMMIVTATAMLRGRSSKAGGGKVALGRALALGACVGVLSGLVGAGGGFLIVPALTLFAGLGIVEAIGTSLFVITLQSFAGFAGHIAHVELDWRLAVVVSAAAVAGSVAGVYIGRKISPEGLRRAFAWFVVAMGLFMIAKQAPVAISAAVAALTFAALWLLARKKTPCTTSHPSPR